MAPRSNSKRQKSQRKYKEDINVVKLVTRGKVSGQFWQRSFGKIRLSPVVRIPLKCIGEGLLEEGHVFLGFIKSGRYILSYTKESDAGDSVSESNSLEPLVGYTLYWWEFNLHRKLKLAQQVKLFAGETDDHLNLHVCEWPNDDSSIAIFGFDAPITSADQHQLMMSMQNNNHAWDWFNCYVVTIAPNPPSKPCSHCSATTTRTGSGGTKCLEHSYAFHGESDAGSAFPFQPALQLKKDKVILLKENLTLVACAIYLCPAGEQSQSCQLLYTKRAGQPSSSPSTLPQHCQQGTPYSSSSPTLPTSSSQDANRYVDYRRLHYHPQPGTAGGGGCVEHGFLPFLSATDLKGRDQKLFPGGPRDGQSLCVEEMYLHVGRLLLVLLHADAVWEARDDATFDFVMLDVSPQTDNVLIGICLFWKCEERDMTVSWDLGTGLCNVLGVSDLTNDAPFEGRLSGNYDATKSYKKSLMDTVMEHSVPESSSHCVNVIDDLPPKSVLADPERCTWVTEALYWA